MTFKWTQHQFSGGLLALDLVNTVVHRNDESARIDRLREPQMIQGFAEAAAEMRAEEVKVAALECPATPEATNALLELREAIDAAFRPLAEQRVSEDLLPQSVLHRLFSAAATAIDPTKTAISRQSLAGACAVSAMKLLDPNARVKLKACPRCDWLFVDRSRNGSRLWCDMAVCGNRAKADAHYRRVRKRKIMEPNSNHDP